MDTYIHAPGDEKECSFRKHIRRSVAKDLAGHNHAHRVMTIYRIASDCFKQWIANGNKYPGSLELSHQPQKNKIKSQKIDDRPFSRHHVRLRPFIIPLLELNDWILTFYL